MMGILMYCAFDQLYLNLRMLQMDYGLWIRILLLRID